MSVDEIKQVCKKSTKPKKKSTSKKLSKPEKVTTVKESSIPKIDIPKKPLNYSIKLGVRRNAGSLTTKHLNPPKNSNTRFYCLYGQIVSSDENRKLPSL